ncbi:MAG: cytochrome c family protein [Terricaulis sp.]
MRALIVALIAALAACSPSPAPSSSSSTTPNAEEAQALATAMQAKVAALPGPYNGADYEAGRRAFGQCRSCHAIEPDAPSRGTGPNLFGVVGRKIGSEADFEYSQAAASANFDWDGAKLDQWLTSPQAFLPGTRMSFAGVRNEKQRRDLIAYLMVASAEAEE